jgi:hypothetical protein
MVHAALSYSHELVSHTELSRLFFLKICHAHKNSIQLQQFLSIFLRKDFTKHIKNLNDFKNNTSTTKGGYPKKIVWTSICENITNYFKNNNNRL